MWNPGTGKTSRPPSPRREAQDLAFVVRLWSTRDGLKTRWQGSVLRTDRDERIGFSCVADLCEYLLAQTVDDDTTVR